MADDQTSQQLILDEIHRVFSAQLTSFQSVSERAATVISVLTGFVTAAVTVEAAVLHPPLWAVALPSALVLVALVFAAQAFRPGAVWLGPQPESLRDNSDAPPGDLRTGLVDFYVGIIASNRTSLERRALEVRYATLFLILATAALLLAGLTLYA